MSEQFSGTKEVSEKLAFNLEDLNISTESKNLLMLKKALYLIRNSEHSEGKEILQNLIDSESNFKSIAKDIINF